MKFWLLLLGMGVMVGAVEAAPAKKVARVQWEYAVLDLNYSRGSGSAKEDGAMLFLPNKKSIFLPSEKTTSNEYKAYIFNRLGSQGWELIMGNGYEGNAANFVFKRVR